MKEQDAGKRKGAIRQWWLEVRSGVKLTLIIWLLLFVYCLVEASYQRFNPVQAENTLLKQQITSLAGCGKMDSTT
jgi:hypothetical protein